MDRSPALTRRTGVLVTVLAVGATALAASPAAAAPRKVPFGFLGVDASGLLVDPSLGDQRLNSEYAQMVRTGVETVRIAVYWSST